MLRMHRVRHFAKVPPKPPVGPFPEQAPGRVKLTPPSPAAAAAAGGPATAAAGAAAAAGTKSADVSQWEAYKLINQLLSAADKARKGEFGAAARTVLLQNLKLEEKYNTSVVPAMDVIKAAKKKLDPEL